MITKKMTLLVLQCSVLSALINNSVQLYAGEQPQEENDIVGIRAGEQPGEGYGPELTGDNESTGGVLSFVSPKGGSCEKLVLTLTEEGKKDGIVMQFFFNKRYPTNHKWKKSDEVRQVELLPIPPGPELVTILYNHAGHRGIHGGSTSRDTHHNWELRLTKNGKRLSTGLDTWRKYLRVILSSSKPSLESVFNGEGAEGKAYMTGDEADKLIAWGFLDPEAAETIKMANEEIKRLEAIESGETVGTEAVSAVVIAALSKFGLELVKKGSQWLIQGVKDLMSTPVGCSSSQTNLITEEERFNLTLSKS